MNRTTTVIKTPEWLFNEIQCQTQTNRNPCLITYSLCFPSWKRGFVERERKLSHNVIYHSSLNGSKWNVWNLFHFPFRPCPDPHASFKNFLKHSLNHSQHYERLFVLFQQQNVASKQNFPFISSTSNGCQGYFLLLKSSRCCVTRCLLITQNVIQFDFNKHFALLITSAIIYFCFKLLQSWFWNIWNELQALITFQFWFQH